MTKKRGYVSDESQHADEQDIVAPPVVRSRRERAVKARLRNDTAGPSSYTDSGSGDHYSPVNITDTPREGTGNAEAFSDVKEQELSRHRASGDNVSKKKRGDGPMKRGPGGIFKTAAIKVLTDAGSLLSSGTIYDRAMRQGLVNESAGKTPEATMAAALYTDIKKYRNQSTFIKPREGLFGLRVWVSDECNILTPAERAEVAANQESDRDSTVQMSGLAPAVSAEDRGQVPRKRVKQASRAKEAIRRRRQPKLGAKDRVDIRRARSHSVPPSERAEPEKGAQPALSEPPAVFANERLQALFMAVDQVSGTTATSDLGSLGASATESEDQPIEESSFNGTPQASGRASWEPEAQSAHVPATQIGNSIGDEGMEADTVQIGLNIKQEGGDLAVPPKHEADDVKAEASQSDLKPAVPANSQNPVNEVNHPLSMGTGKSLTAEERLSALQQISDIEQHLQALDQSNKFDPQVGNCHMQLSSLYLAIGSRDKAIQNYLVALERCEALLA